MCDRYCFGATGFASICRVALNGTPMAAVVFWDVRRNRLRLAFVHVTLPACFLFALLLPHHLMHPSNRIYRGVRCNQLATLA